EEGSLPLSAERCQDLVRKRLVEVVADVDAALEAAGLAGLDSQPYQLRDRPAALGNDDLFSLGNSLQKPGEVGLGLVYVEDSHGDSSLAKLGYFGFLALSSL